MVRKLQPFIDRELHIKDFVAAPQNVTTATDFLLLSAAATGTGVADRTGLQVRLHSIAYKMFFEVGNLDVCVRVTLFRDSMTNGVTPLQAELYEFTLTGSETLLSPINIENVKRFRILADFHVTMSPAWKPLVCLKKFRRLGTIQKHLANTTAIADLLSGGIWIAMTSNTAGGANSPTVNILSRVRFAP